MFPPSSFCAAFQRWKAFTLVELLVVVAIIGLMTALLVPALKGMRDRALQGACVANLRTLGSATQMIVGEQNGSLPGVGQRTTNASTSWQEAISIMAFESTGKDPLQRWGDVKQPGQMYCPAMQKWPAGGTRYPRAYVMNSYVKNPNTNDTIPNYNGILNYLPGRKIVSFAHPQQTIMIFESERDGDFADPYAPYGNITLGDGNSAPAWASANRTWAFRHKKQINVLFMDGHVESFAFQDAKKLNDPLYFYPANQ